MIARRFSWALALLLIVGGAPRGAGADDEAARDPSELKLATTRAVVFKDGYALFVRRGRAIADEDGRVFTSEVPDAAVLGCFWAFADGEEALGMRARLKTEKESRTEDSPCISILDLLRANTGRRVMLHLGSGKEITGTLKGVLDRKPRAGPAGVSHGPVYVHPRSGARPSTSGAGTSEREILPEGGALVRMERAARGEIVLPVAQVESLSGSELVTTRARHFERTIVSKRLEFAMGAAKAGKEVEVRIFYFAPSLRWIPTYRVAGGLKTDADLALQAEVLNEAEDLKDVALDLVVGVPNFRFKQVVSPLVLEATLRNALQQAAPQLMGQQRISNAMFSSRAGESRGRRLSTPANLAPELGVGGSQDMFVYSVPHFSLRSGSRATIPLWQDTVPLRHLYTLDIVLGRDMRAGGSYLRHRGSQAKVSPLDLAKHDVWHQLELENKSQVPWTTGAALTMQGLLPIAQELLTYTPRGAKTLLPLTVAVDVRADFDEEELGREQKAVKHRSYYYARIEKRASIHLINYRDEPTEIRVSLSLGGRAVKASHGGSLRINDYRSNDWNSGGHDARLNHHTDVEWNITLKPRESRDLTCEYEFFLR